MPEMQAGGRHCGFGVEFVYGEGLSIVNALSFMASMPLAAFSLRAGSQREGDRINKILQEYGAEKKAEAKRISKSIDWHHTELRKAAIMQLFIDYYAVKLNQAQGRRKSLKPQLLGWDLGRETKDGSVQQIIDELSPLESVRNWRGE